MFYALVLIFILIQAYVRLAPSAPARWHVDPFTAKDPRRAGVLITKVVPLDPGDALTRLMEQAETEPRTSKIAGTRAAARVTYRCRSAFWGFPDYVTLAARPHAEGAEIALLSRLRFGKSDLGVNGARMAPWLEGAGL